MYLLAVVVEQRKPVFANWQLGRLVVQQFRAAEEAGLVRSLAWVVMPDHFHWLIELRQSSLSDLMCRVKSRSSAAFKRQSSSQSPLWQKGFHDRALRRDEDVLSAGQYVVANPLRAGRVKNLRDSPLWDAIWLEES